MRSGLITNNIRRKPKILKRVGKIINLIYMKKINLMAIMPIFALIILSGCSSSKGKITITTDDARHAARVRSSNDFFEVVPGTYDVTEKDGVLSTTISLIVSEEFENPDYLVEEFILRPTDAEGEIIEINDDWVEFSAENLYAKYDELSNASIGTVVPVTFKCVIADKGQAKNMLMSIVACEVILDVDKPKEKKQSKTNKSSSSASSSADWNKVLDSYEQYADKYIAVMKKVSAGDASAYAEMAELLQQCNDLSEKLEAANDDMNPSQIARFQKIMNKFATAAAAL